MKSFARVFVSFVVSSAGMLRAAEPTPLSNALQVPADVAIDLVLQDPVVAQPVFLNFDERGRMWVVQFLQYPHPAGLANLSRDEFWRSVYDRKKLPPPYDTPEKAAFRGRDKITIHEDVRGDGSFSQVTTFVEGLNITTAVVRGRGGVWVLTPPHLVFYPDANNDDVPDGPPVVHLEGFGLEDTHSMANSLRWGPDGWLYAAQGSTVTAEIVRPGIDRAPIAHIVGQCIWRYHPETRRFEVFAEGGGNAFYVEIDAKGRIYSGHNGGNTRGFHYVQGGYLQKGFDKHGDLSNPYAFGYFPPMPNPPVKRYTHGFLIYEGTALPASYRGRLMGIDPMNYLVTVTEMIPRGTTFSTRDIGALVRTGDRRFRPVDIKHGPDGAVYLADWVDLQLSHRDTAASSVSAKDGRIFRVRGAATKPGLAPFDLTRATSRELVELLRHENRWWREQARRILGDRRDGTLVPALRSALREASGQFALEALWALNLSGGFDEPVARELFEHPDPHVRLWSVRLLGDRGTVTDETAAALAGLAAREPQAEVRGQLAASAKRFSAKVALPLVRALLAHDADAADPYVPLQLWWAIESKCASDRAAVLGAWEAADWQRPLVQQHLAARLIRRFAAAGGRDNLLACATLLEQAPDAATRRRLMEGFEQAFEGRVLPSLPEELVAAMMKAGGGSLALRVRQKEPAALEEALRTMADQKVKPIDRIRLLAVFGEVPHPPAAAVIAELVRAADPTVRSAALAAAAAYEDPQLVRAILAAYPNLTAADQDIAQSVLSSRTASAAALLQAVAGGTIAPAAVRAEMREKIRLVGGGALARRVDEVLGRVETPPAEQLAKEVARVLAVVRPGGGDPYRGRVLYEQSCAACHRLHGKGGEIGPDLTAFKRDDLETFILNTVNPNAAIREGYEMFMAQTKDGAVHSGFLASQDPRRVVLRDMAGVNVSLERGTLASLQSVGRSLMPEGLLGSQTDEQLRDLFAYMQITQPLVVKK